MFERGGGKEKINMPLPPQLANAMKNVDRWRPTDDIMLISAVQQVSGREEVFADVMGDRTGVSCKMATLYI